MKNKLQLIKVISELFKSCANENNAVEVISLSTIDGFSVHSLCANNISIEDDTMSAAASTLYSVGKAVAQQVLSKDFKSTFIEAGSGNVCFVRLLFDSKEYLLAVSAGEAMNIASLRLLINRLADSISNIVV